MLKYWILFTIFVSISSAYETAYAVSYGEDGKNHTDSLGVLYTYTNKDCIKEEKGRLKITTVPTEDRPLYQGYCSNFRNDSTKIPLAGSGRYQLVLKFRVAILNGKVDMVLNKKHYIWRNFEKENGFAYDVTTVFTVCGDNLIFNNEISTIIDNTVDLQLKITEGKVVLLSAIGLFKDDDGKGLPVSLADNIFKANDWSQQTLFVCSDHQVVGKSTQVAPSVTINFYYNFVLNIEDNNLNKDSLVQDEF